VASLDVLDYQVGLDAALAKPGAEGRPLLPETLRRQAVKDARRVLDAMAFRFAVLDERALPEDLDYLRALEAMKPPEAAARVLARRAPVYAANRRRRLVTTWGTLAVLAFLVAGGVYIATSEEAVTLASVEQASTRNVPGGTLNVTRTFEVTPEMNRLHLDGYVFVRQGSVGVIEVFLLGPDNATVYYESFAAGSNPYLRHNVVAPAPGPYWLLVDFLDVDGSVTMTVDGIRPTR
jgi:hypothetical protein